MSFETLVGILDAIDSLADGMAGDGEVSRLVGEARPVAKANEEAWERTVSSLDAEIGNLRGMAGLEE